MHLVNICSKKFREREDNSLKHKSEMEDFTKSLIDYYSNNIGEAYLKNPYKGYNQEISISDKEYIPNPKMSQWIFSILFNMSRTHHCEVFLEEPEQNLFPPTQQILMRTLLKLIKSEKANTLFVSTHSPYILDVLLERGNYDFGMFYIQSSENGSVVRTATEEDVQDMYEDGVDAFFNIERFGNEA